MNDPINNIRNTKPKSFSAWINHHAAMIENLRFAYCRMHNIHRHNQSDFGIQVPLPANPTHLDTLMNN